MRTDTQLFPQKTQLRYSMSLIRSRWIKHSLNTKTVSSKTKNNASDYKRRKTYKDKRKKGVKQKVYQTNLNMYEIPPKTMNRAFEYNMKNK